MGLDRRGPGLVAIVVLSYLALHRPAAPRFTAPGSADATGLARRRHPDDPRPTTAPTDPTEPARVFVVGEGFSSPPATGGGWPELVRGDLGPPVVRWR